MEVKPKIYFIMDSCGSEWDTMIKKLVPWKYETEHVNLGSLFRTLPLQWSMAKELDDYVLFQEDDYVYLKGAGKKIEQAMKELEFVAPYDHLEFYTVNKDFHHGPFEIKLIGNQHWRTIDFNTMTWGCHSGRLTTYWEQLNMKGYWDKDTWEEIGKEGGKLWSPIPTLCTHMHADFLSPGIDWNRRFCELDK